MKRVGLVPLNKNKPFQRKRSQPKSEQEKPKSLKVNGDSLPQIINLPMLFLSKVASQLSLRDMRSFWSSFKLAYQAVDHFWISQRSLNLSPNILKIYFPDSPHLQDKPFHWYSAHREIIRFIGYMPHNRLKVLDFEGTFSFDWNLFLSCLEENELDPECYFNNVEFANYRECVISSDDLILMSEKTPSLRSISLTESLFHLYVDDQKLVEESKINIDNRFQLERKGIVNRNRQKILTFLGKIFPKLESVTLYP